MLVLSQLAVVVVSVIRNRSSLAIGNVVGSAIANILGAFSLGLLFYKKTSNHQTLFERSSIIYSVALLVVTVMASALLAFGRRIDWRAAGGAFIALFAVYLVSISWLIAKGITKAPEGSDTSSDTDSIDSDVDTASIAIEDEDHVEDEVQSDRREPLQAPVPDVWGDTNIAGAGLALRPLTKGRPRKTKEVRSEGNHEENSTSPSMRNDSNLHRIAEDDTIHAPPMTGAEESISLSVRRRRGLPSGEAHEGTSSLSSTVTSPVASRKQPRGMAYHFVMLGIGFIAIVLSGFVLSNAASNIVDEFGISDVLAGVVILSIATTIPEKFVAVLSGYKGHMDIMLANTVGSNIFLLTLCIGIVWVATGGEYNCGDVVPAEIGVMFGSTVALALTVLLQGRFARIIGAVLLSCYIAFIVLEFTVIHKV